MVNAVTVAPSLDELVRLRDLQPLVANVFPTKGSVDWHLRMHRREYVEKGAVVEIAGRVLVHPETFKRVALEIAARRATEDLEGAG